MSRMPGYEFVENTTWTGGDYKLNRTEIIPWAAHRRTLAQHEADRAGQQMTCTTCQSDWPSPSEYTDRFLLRGPNIRK